MQQLKTSHCNSFMNALTRWMPGTEGGESQGFGMLVDAQGVAGFTLKNIMMNFAWLDYCVCRFKKSYFIRTPRSGGRATMLELCNTRHVSP